jgi:hypothetical protein
MTQGSLLNRHIYAKCGVVANKPFFALPIAISGVPTFGVCHV